MWCHPLPAPAKLARSSCRPRKMLPFHSRIHSNSLSTPRLRANLQSDRVPTRALENKFLYRLTFIYFIFHAASAACEAGLTAIDALTLISRRKASWAGKALKISSAQAFWYFGYSRALTCALVFTIEEVTLQLVPCPVCLPHGLAELGSIMQRYLARIRTDT